MFASYIMEPFQSPSSPLFSGPILAKAGTSPMVIITRFEYTEQSRSGWKPSKQYFRRAGDTPLELSPGNTTAWSGLIEELRINGVSFAIAIVLHCVSYITFFLVSHWQCLPTFLRNTSGDPRDLALLLPPGQARLVIVTCKTSSFWWELEDEAIHSARPFGERFPQTTVIGPTVRPSLLAFHSRRPRHHHHGVAGSDAAAMCLPYRLLKVRTNRKTSMKKM